MPAKLSSGLFPSWDDYRFFLATIKAGSFTKAANELGVTQSTLSRRIDHLEQQLGVRLFGRLKTGVVLTSEGESILDVAQQIESSVLEIQRRMLGSDKRLGGAVRISVTDGLATYWLIPRLASLQERHPGISIEFQCSIDPADAFKLETDLSVRYKFPDAADLKVVKLGTFHFVPWASPAYLERHGSPSAPEELVNHRLLNHLSYADDYDDSNVGNWNTWYQLVRAANLLSCTTNSSASLLSAIQSGLGIGMQPTYVCEFVDEIVPLDIGLRTHSSIWLTYHPNIQNTARMRIVIDWMKDLFDPGAWPWFKDEFVPPTAPKN